MSTPNPEDSGRPSDSNHWRAPPPHMPLSTGTEQFMSAPSQPANSSPPPRGPRADSETSGERTSSPGALSGLTATVQKDEHGRQYFQESSTHLRIDLFDQQGQPILAGPTAASEQPQNGTDGRNPSSTLSDESDVTPETRSDHTATTTTPESMIQALLDGIEPHELSAAHLGMLQTVQGALVTSRLRLLNTTSVVVDQRKNSQNTRDSLQQFRDETADRLTAFDDAIRGDHLSMEQCIEENVRLLTELGQSEDTMTRLLLQIRRSHRREAPLPALPHISQPQPLDISDSVAADLASALPPRKPTETQADFRRRAALSSASSKRAAEAFVLPEPQSGNPARDVPPPFKSTRFEDPGSISSAPRYRQAAPTGVPIPPVPGPPISAFERTSIVSRPTLDAMEEFSQEAEALLRAIIYRQVGLELTNVPARVRAPKLDNPSKYSGANDHQEFITWLEELVTWMRASFMGGPAADSYRITVLKTNLVGNALKWFIDYVETRTGISAIQYDFESVICAMHRRFVTAATAQKASRAFEAVKYKAEDGPLKLMDDLVDTSALMREPMPDFIIRQRFMKLLPESISGLMSLHRNLSAEYTDAATLRFNAWQIWDAYNANKTARLASHTSTPASTAAASTTTAKPFAARRETPRTTATAPPTERRAPPGTHSPSSVPHNSTTVIGPNAHKRCFRCGFLGHIGTDKVCPKNADNPRVAAQRVMEEFVEEDHVVADDEGAHEPMLVDDHWGGSQFDPDHGHEEHAHSPAEINDLGDLIDLGDGPTARVGAMHFQGYSMRVEPELEPDIEETGDEGTTSPVDETEASTGPTLGEVTLTRTQLLLCEAHGIEPERSVTLVSELYEATAYHDLIRLREYRRVNGLPPYSEEELSEFRRELVTEHEYLVSEFTNYDDAMHHFQIHEGPATEESMSEWAAIMVLGAAEHCQLEASVAGSMPLGNHMTLNSRDLERDAERLLADAARYVPHLQDMRDALDTAIAVRDTAQLALDEAPIRMNLDATGRARGINNRALDIYRDTLEEMTVLSDGITHSMRHLEALQSVIIEELRIRRNEQEALLGPATSSADTDASDDEDGTAPSDGASDGGDSVSPPPSYRSDSTHNPDASPPVSENGDGMGSRLTNLNWHDIMVAAAAASNAAIHNPGMAPIEAPRAPPDYQSSRIPNQILPDGGGPYARRESAASSEDGSATSSSAPDDGESAADRAGGAQEIALLSRRIVEDYYPHLRDEEHHGMVFGTEFDDRSPGELQFIFGEGGDDADRNWPRLPEIDTGVSIEQHMAQVAEREAQSSTATGVSELGSPNPLASPQCLNADESPATPEEYTLVDLSYCDPEPRETDELLIRTLIPTMGQETAEWCYTYVDHRGTLYTRTAPLPDTHYLSPAMHADHLAAMDTAITERAIEMNCSRNVVRSSLETNLEPQGLRERMGFRDASPPLIPGEAIHERIASLGPEHDDPHALPGFRVQALSQRVEHIATVNRPDSIPRVGITAQPSRKINQIACLTAELQIGGSKAYVLFDSGSNTDSLTPEYARLAKCNVFKLDDTVTL
ncbi:hypothetical protein DFH06DRAFT_1335609 [Mycena polygramma]|nr:hypothetical protein DFH06DRAFT_1335609 [Mycena polygramma]